MTDPRKEDEVGSLFVLCGVVVLLVKAPPRRLLAWAGSARGLPALGWPLVLLTGLAIPATLGVLGQILWFFTKAGAFVFGSGLAIVPFLTAASCRSTGGSPTSSSSTRSRWPCSRRGRS